jgi:hypothetical protein
MSSCRQKCPDFADSGQEIRDAHDRCSSTRTPLSRWPCNLDRGPFRIRAEMHRIVRSRFERLNPRNLESAISQMWRPRPLCLNKRRKSTFPNRRLEPRAVMKLNARMAGWSGCARREGSSDLWLPNWLALAHRSSEVAHMLDRDHGMSVEGTGLTFIHENVPGPHLRYSFL